MYAKNTIEYAVNTNFLHYRTFNPPSTVLGTVKQPRYGKKMFLPYV